MGYAFYKESGEPWTKEEVQYIQHRYPAPSGHYTVLNNDALKRKWVLYSADNRSGYYMWYRQTELENFHLLTQRSFENLQGTPKLPIYTIKDYQ